MTTIADKLYTLYNLNENSSDGFSTSKIKTTMDDIISEALEIFNLDVELLDEGFLDSFKSFFHIGNNPSKEKVKSTLNQFKIKDESDLKKIKAMTDKYENKLPTNEELQKKSIELLDKLGGQIDRAQFKNIFSRFIGWINALQLGIVGFPFAIILTVCVFIRSIIKKENPLKTFSKIHGEIRKAVQIKHTPKSGSISLAIALSNGMIYFSWISLFLTFGIGTILLTPLFIGLFVIALLMFWAGVFKAGLISEKS